MGNHTEMSAIRIPIVSVIVPAYNVSAYIGEALDSALAQDFREYEIIVVNDGSTDTDQLERVLTSYENSIIYLKQENKGISAARNAALRLARGEYVALLDADDVWLPNKLSKQIEFIVANGYDLVYSNALLFGDSGYPSGTTFMDNSPSEDDVTLERLLSGRCCVACCTVLAKKDAIFAAGLFDEEERQITEDFDLWTRMLMQGARIGYQREVLAKYRYRRDSISADRIYLHEAALRVLNKLRNTNLTDAERRALELTSDKLASGVALERARLMIRDGEFAAARQSLVSMKRDLRNWKTNLAVVGLAVWPSLVQKFVLTSRNSVANSPLR